MGQYTYFFLVGFRPGDLSDKSIPAIASSLRMNSILPNGLPVRVCCLLAHAWEQKQQGGRNKGPIPRRTIWSYDGSRYRHLPDE